MYKSRMKVELTRLSSTIKENSKVLWFVWMVVVGMIATYTSASVYLSNKELLLFDNPNTIAQNLANIPIVFSGVVAICIVILGVSIGSLFTITRSIKFSLGGASVEITEKDKEITKADRHLKFMSTLLKNRYDTMETVVNKGKITTESFLEECLTDYELIVNKTEGQVCVEVEIKTSKNDLNRAERRILKSIMENSDENVVYKNRLLGKKNIMFGVAKEYYTKEDLYIIITADPTYEFNSYDQESIVSIIEFSEIQIDLCEFIMET